MEISIEDARKYLLPQTSLAYTIAKAGFFDTFDSILYNQSEIKYWNNNVMLISSHFHPQVIENYLLNRGGEQKVVRLENLNTAVYFPRPIRAGNIIFKANNRSIVGEYWKERNILMIGDIAAIRKVNKLIAVLKEIKKYIKRVKPLLNISMGCDPEFILINEKNEEVIRASTIIRGGTSSPIGVDGYSALMEVRPGIASTPSKLIRKFKDTLLQIPPEATRYKISYDRYDYPCGGHIHIGNINPYYAELLSYIYATAIGYFHYQQFGDRGSYGNPLSYERKWYGFEYRALSSGIFFDKKLLNIILNLFYSITKDFLKGKEFNIYVNYDAYKEDYGKLTPLILSDYLSLDDKTYLMDRIRELRGNIRKPDLIAAWKVHTRRRIKKINISFSETWLPETMKDIASYHFQYNKLALYIRLVGLHEERGERVDIPRDLLGYKAKPPFKILETPVLGSSERTDNNTYRINIGIPYEWRRAYTPDRVEKIIHTVQWVIYRLNKLVSENIT